MRLINMRLGLEGVIRAEIVSDQHPAKTQLRGKNISEGGA